MTHYRLPTQNVLPETYRLDVLSEREEFFKTYIGKVHIQVITFLIMCRKRVMDL